MRSINSATRRVLVEDAELIELLQHATEDELSTLHRMLGAECPSADAVAESFVWHGTSAFGYFLGKRVAYSALVRDVAKTLGVPTRGPLGELERGIVQHLWRTVWERMSTCERQEFDRKLRQASLERGSNVSLTGAALSGATLLTAQLSGFGVYVLASSTLGAITAGLGVTLPFGVYTTMSSAIATVIGPVGWIGLGILVIHKLTGPNHQKITCGIVMVHCIRARIAAEQLAAQEAAAAAAARKAQGLAMCLATVALGLILVCAAMAHFGWTP